MLSKYKIPNHAPKNPVSSDAAIDSVNKTYIESVNEHNIKLQNKNPRPKSNLMKMTRDLSKN